MTAAHTTIRKTGLPPRWRVSIDASVVANVDSYEAAQEAAETVWGAAAGDAHVSGREFITSKDPERGAYGWRRVKGGWLCNDARDPSFPNLG